MSYRQQEKGLPSAPRLRAWCVPPAPSPCGAHPCPPCAAAVPPPARPACGSPGNVAAGRRLRRLRPSQPPAVAWGTPPAAQGQGKPPAAGLAPLLPHARCGVGAPARPGPHNVGALGPSAPPARAAALRPASPARPPPTAAGRAARLCLRTRRPA